MEFRPGVVSLNPSPWPRCIEINGLCMVVVHHLFIIPYHPRHSTGPDIGTLTDPRLLSFSLNTKPTVCQGQGQEESRLASCWFFDRYQGAPLIPSPMIPQTMISIPRWFLGTVCDQPCIIENSVVFTPHLKAFQWLSRFGCLHFAPTLLFSVFRPSDCWSSGGFRNTLTLRTRTWGLRG